MLSTDQLEKLDENIRKLQTDNVNIKLRGLDNMEKWELYEWALALLHGKEMFVGVLNQRWSVHASEFIDVRIFLLKRYMRMGDIEKYAERYRQNLNGWIQLLNSGQLLPELQRKAKPHYERHLFRAMRRFGPLRDRSCFKYERKHKPMKRGIKHSNHKDAQIQTATNDKIKERLDTAYPWVVKQRPGYISLGEYMYSKKQTRDGERIVLTDLMYCFRHFSKSEQNFFNKYCILFDKIICFWSVMKYKE